MTRKTRTEEEYRELFQLLAFLIWTQPHQELRVNRNAYDRMPDMKDMELVRSDASNGDIRFKAKHTPLEGDRAALKDK